MILSTGKIIYTHLQFSAESEFTEMAKKHTNGEKKKNHHFAHCPIRKPTTT